MDETVNTDELEKYSFQERLPIGIYSFTIEDGNSDKHQDGFDRHCEVLVYDTNNKEYFDFVDSLEDIFKMHNIQTDREQFVDNELKHLSKFVKDEFFTGSDIILGGDITQNINNILQYYMINEVKPDFLPFKDRKKYNINEIAKEIVDSDLGPKAKRDLIYIKWDQHESVWKGFFGHDNIKHFRDQIQKEINLIVYADEYKKSQSLLTTQKEKLTLLKFTLEQLKEKNPPYYKYLHEHVFDRAKDEDGYYHCAKSAFKSKKTVYFHIDHIIPIKQGGLTELDNLQLLERKENWRKKERQIINFKKS